MAKQISVNAVNPQKRLLQHVSGILAAGGLVICPTETSYSLLWHLEDKKTLDRVRTLRQLPKKHPMTLVFPELSSIATYARVDNYAFRLLKSTTPGPYTFILKATREVPKRLIHPNKKTIGIRVSAHPILVQLLALLSEPLMSTTLLLPQYELPLTEPDEIHAAWGHAVDVIIDGGICGQELTSVIDLTGDFPVVLRQGKGDVQQFSV